MGVCMHVCVLRASVCAATSVYGVLTSRGTEVRKGLEGGWSHC